MMEPLLIVGGLPLATIGAELARFGAFVSTLPSALISTATTVVTGIAGFVVLLWRLRVEAQRAIDQMAAAEAMKLKLRIYEQEVVTIADGVIDAQVALSGFIRRFENELTNHRILSSHGMPATLPVARIPELMDLKSAFDQETVKIVTFTERWAIIDPRISIFRTAISAALHDVSASWGLYFQLALPAMPIDLPAGPHWVPPHDQAAREVIEAGKELIDHLTTVTAYAGDFRVELQSLLLGSLFGHPITKRQPIDPKYKVVSLDQVAALSDHFHTTAWGTRQREIEEDVRRSLPERASDE